MRSLELDRLISEEFDIAYSGRPRKALIIATTPRTGSNLLCSELWRRGRVGAPWEYFSRKFVVPPLSKRLKSRTRATYVEALLRYRTGLNGTFSIKVFHDDLCIFRNELLDSLDGAEIHYVFLIRKSLSNQVDSLMRARRTREWAITSERHAGEINFQSDKETERQYFAMKISEQNFRWRSHFSEMSVKPLTLTYEDMRFPEDLERIEILLGVQNEPISFIDTPKFLKQTPGESSIFT
jgi:LPS sulfotransferase NodH